MKVVDKYRRTHDYLRISITDRCNSNCFYCNPQSVETKFNNKTELLSYDEIFRLASIFVNKLEFKKIRITGGEPFVKKDIGELFNYLHILKKDQPFELAITTNGTLLNGNIGELINSGLDRINFSLDSLKPDKYLKITGQNLLDKVLHNIEEAKKYKFEKIKINTVVINNYNDDEIFDFLDFAFRTGCEIRFIEYMPFSGNGYDKDKFIPSEDIRNIIKKMYTLEPIKIENNSVSRDFYIKELNIKVGFISAISDHFCESCNRLRLTAYGKLKLCLFSRKDNEIDLRELLQKGFEDDDIASIIVTKIQSKEFTHPEFDELITLKNENIISIGG